MYAAHLTHAISSKHSTLSSATLQHALLIQSPHTLSKLSLLQSYQHSHTHHQHISPFRHLPQCIQPGSGNPTAKKTYIKHFSYRWPVSLLPFIVKTLERVVFNQLSLFLLHNHKSIIYWMLINQDSDMDIHMRLRFSQSLKPCELQKLIPNHQFSFGWIYLLLLTLLTIRSPCPLSHHWASQGFHFAGLDPISLAGPSRWPGEGRYPQSSQVKSPLFI